MNHIYSIHGCAMEIESPQDILELVRSGPGIYLRGYPGTTNVFHFPIPADFHFNQGSDFQVSGARLYFNTGKHAVVTTVNINDGKDLLYSSNDIYKKELGLQGNHNPWDMDFEVLNVQKPYKIASKALSIVVHVAFLKATRWPPFVDGSISFEAAGVRRYDPIP